MSPFQRVTQKQVAEKLGLTPSAVSRAMRNDRRIPRSTCLKVQKTARAMGYQPDPEISKMMGYLRRSRGSPAASSIALLNLHSSDRFASINRFTERMHAHLERFARECGYALAEFNLLNARPEALRRIMRARGIDGIIIPGASHARQTVDFDFSDFSVVTIGYSFAMNLHRACQDQFSEMRLVLDKLRQAG